MAKIEVEPSQGSTCVNLDVGSTRHLRTLKASHLRTLQTSHLRTEKPRHPRTLRLGTSHFGFGWGGGVGEGWGGVRWGGMITFMFLCTHRHSNVIIFLPVEQRQAQLFHDQLPVGRGELRFMFLCIQTHSNLIIFEHLHALLFHDQLRGWGDGVGWGGMITFMFLCTHRHSNLIIVLPVEQRQAQLFHDQLPVGWGELIRFMFLCLHTHSNLIIFLAVEHLHALLFHDQLPVV